MYQGDCIVIALPPTGRAQKVTNWDLYKSSCCFYLLKTQFLECIGTLGLPLYPLGVITPHLCLSPEVLLPLSGETKADFGKKLLFFF